MLAPFDLIKEAQQFIRFNTVTTHGNADCALYAGKLLHRLGFRVQYQEYREGGQAYLNVIGLLGEGPGPLMLAAHLDTVDPGDPKLWTKTGGNPWRAVVRGDALYGLGSADDKVDFLCKLMAVAQVKLSSLRRPLMVVGTFGEERGLLGAARLCQGSLPKPAMAIVGEPSNLQLILRHKGLLVGELSLLRRGIYRAETAEMACEVETHGVAAHSSAPQLGQNAIVAMLELLGQPSLGFKVVQVDGGTAPNIVPQRCTALLILTPAARQALAARRGVTLRPKRLPEGWYPTLPWADLLAFVQKMESVVAPVRAARDRAFKPPTLTATITQLKVVEGALTLTFDLRTLPSHSLDRLAKRYEQLGWTLFGPPGDRWQFRRERQNPPLDLPKTMPLVKMMLSAMRVARVPAVVTAKSGCSEAGWYQMVGIPSVVFGPGQAQGNIHQPNERNSLRQIRRAIAVYRQVIERACMG